MQLLQFRLNILIFKLHKLSCMFVLFFDINNEINAMKCSMSSNQNQHYINDAIELLWQYGSYSRKRHSKLTQCQFIIIHGILIFVHFMKLIIQRIDIIKSPYNMLCRGSTKIPFFLKP